ncbi:hypothetical protein [Hydrogenophaga sp. PAMC20947]|nr:hypothetical protein [Hydrogenophaga sp. PAMC20947]
MRPNPQLRACNALDQLRCDHNRMRQGGTGGKGGTGGPEAKAAIV